MAVWVRQGGEEGFPGIAHPLTGKAEEPQQTATAPVIQRQGGGQKSFAFSKNATKGKNKEKEPERVGGPGCPCALLVPQGERVGGEDGAERFTGTPTYQTPMSPGAVSASPPLPPDAACHTDLLSQQRCELKPTLPPSPSRRRTPLPKPSYMGATT